MKGLFATFSITTLNKTLCYYAKWRVFYCYAECHYAECRVFIVMLNVIMLCVVMLSVVMLNVVAHSDSGEV
jgi:hypothetical protein